MNRQYNQQYNLNILQTPEAAATALAREVISQTRFCMQRKGSCIWAVSGGSSIHKIYDALSEQKNVLDEFGKNLTVLWVDERGVPYSHKSSNYGNAYDYFWKQYGKVHLLPVPYHQDIEKSAREYNSMIHKNGIDKIDITLLGMGTDGHTASLFPHNRALEEKHLKVVSVEDPSVELPRVSLTFPFLNSSSFICLYFYGHEKARVFRKANLVGNVNKFPFLGIKKNHLSIYSDQGLNNPY